MESGNEYLISTYDKNWVYDGDTIEFITTNFYNASIDDVINELKESKKKFIDNLNIVFNERNIFQKYGKINVMKNNYPFAVYLTNIYNNGMFNNGTLHINITLPTYLDENRKIQNKDDFILIHKNYIKYIQFVEPLLIARFGSPDVFSKDGELKHLFSGGSQRCAVSRYIGVGSYDTNLMMTGKLLTDDIESMEICKRENWWYNKYHKNSGYVKLDKVGYDINFNKHYNHGVEIRIFDHIDNIHEIKNILEFLIYLGDYVLDSENSRTIEKSYGTQKSLYMLND
jgi:hypothetical protein